MWWKSFLLVVAGWLIAGVGLFLMVSFYTLLNQYVSADVIATGILGSFIFGICWVLAYSGFRSGF